MPTADAPALPPFEPSPADPFDRRKAAHLLRRAGFGATTKEIDSAVERGLEATVEQFFDDAEAAAQEAEFRATFEAVNNRLVAFDETEGLQAWWVYRMARTRTPLVEKLTLFWHGHFATSNDKVDNAWLAHRQVETLRRHAWSGLRELTLAVAKDPAMIVWLDGESSTKAHPNENFARELLELFTCGIGHYTERDVQEAARAFTGWHREDAEFAFKADDHDAGRKGFLGKSGRFDGGDVVDILMQQPATARFVAGKLLRFFAAPEPPAEVLEEAAALYTRTGLNAKWFLRELFLSRWFFSPACYRSRLASPAEYAVGAVRALGARWPSGVVAEHLGSMGQRLYAPPNVKGWDGESAWVGSATWAARQQFAADLAALEGGSPVDAGYDLAALVPGDPTEPPAVADALAETLLQGDLPAEARRGLADLMAAAESPAEGEGEAEGEPKGDSPRAEVPFRDDPEVRARRTRLALAVLIGLPEYQAY